MTWTWKFLLFLPLVLVLGCGDGTLSFPDPNATYQIAFAAYQPLCVDVYNASTTPNTPVIVYPCAPSATSQFWRFVPVGAAGSYNIVNTNSSLCMSVVDAFDTNPGQVMILEKCAANGSKANQVWSLADSSVASGKNLVVSVSQQCLDLPYGAIASIFQLQQYYCTKSDPAQSWKLLLAKV